MVIVKSKIDFATSMRRIFQSMAGKIFDFQCKRQRKVVKNFPESKIVVRFWLVQLLLAAIALVTLKIR